MASPKRSIAAAGGLQPYLDSDYQRSQHNGHGYDKFVELYHSWVELDGSKKRWREIMNIGSPNTLDYYINEYQKNQG